MDVEPVAIHGDGDGQMLSSMFVISVGRAWGDDRVAPYLAGGAGFLNLQARAGALIGLRGPWVARVEVRPQLSIPCAEGGVFGGVGVGRRFGRGDVPVTVLAAAEAGPGWTRPMCGLGIDEARRSERSWFGGGTLSLSFGL